MFPKEQVIILYILGGIDNLVNADDAKKNFFERSFPQGTLPPVSNINLFGNCGSHQQFPHESGIFTERF